MPQKAVRAACHLKLPLQQVVLLTVDGRDLTRSVLNITTATLLVTTPATRNVVQGAPRHHESNSGDSVCVNKRLPTWWNHAG